MREESQEKEVCGGKGGWSSCAREKILLATHARGSSYLSGSRGVAWRCAPVARYREHALAGLTSGGAKRADPWCSDAMTRQERQARRTAFGEMN